LKDTPKLSITESLTAEIWLITIHSPHHIYVFIDVGTINPVEEIKEENSFQGIVSNSIQ